MYTNLRKRASIHASLGNSVIYRRLQSTGFHCYQMHDRAAIIRTLSLLKVIFTTRVIGCRGAGLSECDTPLMGGGDTCEAARNRPLFTALLNAPRLLSRRIISGQPQSQHQNGCYSSFCIYYRYGEASRTPTSLYSEMI